MTACSPWRRVGLLVVAVLVLALLVVPSAQTWQGAPAPPVDRIDDGAISGREVLRQVTLGTVLLLVLVSYRRDIFRKLDDVRRERDELQETLASNTQALRDAAIASARQTDATHRLARIAERLETRA